MRDVRIVYNNIETTNQKWMEYSELVQALQDGDDARVNEIFNELVPRLRRFLEIHMGASRSDAEDCVQQSIELSLGVLRENKLNDPDKILTYLMTTCRNTFLKEQQKKREVTYKQVPPGHFQNPGQFKSLVDEERMKILKQCLDELKGGYRQFIEYLFAHPNANAEMVADHFNISVNNVWTRKHRIIKRLNNCYKNKINQ